MKKYLLFLLLATVTSTSFGQFIAKGGNIRQQAHQAVTESKTIAGRTGTVVYGHIDENGDTTLIVYLPEMDIHLLGRYYEIIETRQGRRLANNVRKVYPYAKLAAQKLQEYDSLLCMTESERERKNMMKDAEDDITANYADELKNLTLTQGAILIRLVDRETGNTSYHLVQELRGKLRAAFYQGFARLWGYNLKDEFDPKNNKEDEQIDNIATLLERGCI